nr:hypothetical protein [Tanacetum cinerariifolium]
MAKGEIDNLTMEQYLALTRGNQASSVVEPEIGGNRVLDIVSLFNILGVSHDVVMLRVFPITLTGAAKRWVDRLPPRTIDSWDLLKKPLSKDCSKSKGIAAIVNKLENLSRDMKKLKENVYAILVGCQICEGAHLDKDCPLNEEVKSSLYKEVEFEVSSTRFHVVMEVAVVMVFDRGGSRNEGMVVSRWRWWQLLWVAAARGNGVMNVAAVGDEMRVVVTTGGSRNEGMVVSRWRWWRLLWVAAARGNGVMNVATVGDEMRVVVTT